jgi:hypothetical protein
MAKNLLNHAWVVNDGHDAYRALTDGAAKRVNMPDAQDEGSPPLGGQFQRWRRGNARAAGNERWR